MLFKQVIENINILLSGKMWFLGALVAGIFSANIANLLTYFKTGNEVVWIMINLIPILVALVLVKSWCNGSIFK